MTVQALLYTGVKKKFKNLIARQIFWLPEEGERVCTSQKMLCFAQKDQLDAIYRNTGVYCEPYGSQKSTILAKCIDSVLNLVVHTTGLQRTIELPFTVSQTVHVKTGVIYIFYDICSNFNVFFQYETQDDDNLPLALCGWTSSCLLTTV